jgi:hypothetical protein
MIALWLPGTRTDSGGAAGSYADRAAMQAGGMARNANVIYPLDQPKVVCNHLPPAAASITWTA